MPAITSVVTKNFLILSLIFLSFFFLLSHVRTNRSETPLRMVSQFKYTAIKGLFEHDSQPQGPPFEAITLPGLGLIDQPYESDSTLDASRKYTNWERFAHYLDFLNQKEKGEASYKLIYTARHGQGYHNVKEAEVGTEAWEAYWARLDGDDKMTWADAHLTETGHQQAVDMSSFWAESAVSLKLPLPPRHYSSPLARCVETCELAFSNLFLPKSDIPVPPFKPIIKELIRERLGIHTCDRRRSKTWIHENHPLFTFEEGFSEEDVLWVPDVRETIEQHAVRVKGFLDDLFVNDVDNQIVSVTAHSGTILALYVVIEHPEVRVAPGAIVPIVIKAEVV